MRHLTEVDGVTPGKQAPDFELIQVLSDIKFGSSRLKHSLVQLNLLNCSTVPRSSGSGSGCKGFGDSAKVGAGKTPPLNSPGGVFVSHRRL